MLAVAHPVVACYKNLSLTATEQSSQEGASWKKGHSHIAGPELPATQKAPEPSNCLLRPSVPVGRVLAVVENISVISSTRLG